MKRRLRLAEPARDAPAPAPAARASVPPPSNPGWSQFALHQARLQDGFARTSGSEAFEQDADRVADALVGDPLAAATPAALGAAGAEPVSAPGPREDAARRDGAALPGGTPLPVADAQRLGAQLGEDLSDVRVHSGAEASSLADGLDARAFTSGRDIVFNHGEYAPESPRGRHLLAHELAHVAQQRRRGVSLQRKPKAGATATAPDPLCTTYSRDRLQLALIATALTTYAVLAKLLKPDSTKNKAVLRDARSALVRAVKPELRCATPSQQAETRKSLTDRLGKDEGDGVWQEAGQVFGGYTGMFPDYAPDVKAELKKLGASDTLGFGDFALGAGAAGYKKDAQQTAKDELGDLGRTDIVYFRGHQFAQYSAPGLFSNGDESRGLDLRYIQKAGGFGNVKLLISTSCATLCREAFAVFHALFPNAVILGYRKSAPLDGATVRKTFRGKLDALQRPLLLDQAVDVASIVGAWKATIEQRHAGDTAQLPGYYDGSLVHYWDGKTWQTIDPSAAANQCKSKGDFSAQYPGP